MQRVRENDSEGRRAGMERRQSGSYNHTTRVKGNDKGPLFISGDYSDLCFQFPYTETLEHF